jgi:hypothetical protein
MPDVDIAMIKPKRTLDARKAAKPAVTCQLEILALRSIDLANRVVAGEMEFIDAIDMAYSAAIWADLPNAIDKSGLINCNISGGPCGDDIVQATIAAAFASARGSA